jgi:hypothetical protein
MGFKRGKNYPPPPENLSHGYLQVAALTDTSWDRILLLISFSKAIHGSSFLLQLKNPYCVLLLLVANDGEMLDLRPSNGDYG